MKLQSEAKIIPNIGLGGLKLRAKITDIQELLTGLGVSKKGSFRIISPFEVAYSFAEGEVEATVDIRNGKIFRLTAQKGYAGTFSV